MHRSARRTSRTALAVATALTLALALAACGDDSSDATTTTAGGEADANTVHISLTEAEGGTVQGVDADRTTFVAGVSYHFVVENTGTRSHELMIIEPLEPGSMDMEEMDEMALYVVEEDDLGPQGVAEFDFTFPADAVGQPLEFACYLEGHYEAGMHAAISVTD